MSEPTSEPKPMFIRKSIVRNVSINLQDWELGDWPERLSAAGVVNVETSEQRIEITLNFNKATEEAVKSIVKEGIEAFFNDCQVCISPRGFYIACSTQDEPLCTIDWDDYIFLEAPAVTIPRLAQWIIDSRSEFDLSEPDVKAWWNQMEAIMKQLAALKE